MTNAKLPGSGTRVPLRAKMPVDSRGSEARSMKSIETMGLVLRPKAARLRVVGYNSGKDAPLSSGVMLPKSCRPKPIIAGLGWKNQSELLNCKVGLTEASAK